MPADVLGEMRKLDLELAFELDKTQETAKTLAELVSGHLMCAICILDQTMSRPAAIDAIINYLQENRE